MIDRLQRAIEHVDDLSPEVQDDVAQYIEEQTALADEELAVSQPHDDSSRLP